MAPTISSLTDTELRRTFDSGSLSRGKVYAHAGRVSIQSLDDDGTQASGAVRGTDPKVYSTTVQLRETRAGGTHVVATCSCPVGFGCKHAVALIIAIRSSGQAEDAGTEPEPEWEREPAPVVSHPSWQRRTARPAAPQWRSALSPLVTSEVFRNRAEWALRFDLAPAYYRGEALLSARPLKRGAKGSWIKTGATWPDVEASTRAFSGGNPQVDALAELQVAVRTHYSHVRRSDGTIDLGGLTRDAWRVFGTLVDTGVTLLGPDGADVTVRREPIAVTIDVTPHDDGGLLVSVDLSDDDVSEAWAADRTMVLGQPAHGIAAWDDDHPSHLWLAPFVEPLDQPMRMLLANREGVHVPEGDSYEFLRDFYPRLQRAVGTVTVDPRIHVPEIVPPRLAVTVKHDGLTAELEWGFTYEIDGETIRTTWAPQRGEPFRDRTAEQQLIEDFVPPPGLPVTTSASGRLALVPQARLDGYPAAVLSQDVVPALTASGVDVSTLGDRPDYRLADTAPVVHISVEDGKDPRSDWYDLAVTVTIDGEKVHFGPLFAALAAGESHVVLLSGTYLSIDRPELEQLRELIQEARELTDRRSDKLRVSRYQAGMWEELVALGTIDKQSASWQQAIGALASLDDIPVPELPAGLDADLRPYQLEGYAWLSFLADHGLGGILADDMGLGKTLQALAMITRQVERRSGPFLVVAPTSVVGNWAREAERFAPGLKVVTITSSRKRRGSELAEAIEGADVVVTSYALFRIENDAYRERQWAGLLLDEAQFVKNHQGKTYQCARRLDARFKLAITGTPLENSLMDLWSMLSIVAPGLYPDPQRFAESYQRPIETGHGRDKLERLQRRVRPLMRRRTKEEVASDLPPKTEQVLQVELGAKHARIYQTHLQRERQKVMGLLADDSSDNRFEVLRSLTKLRLLSLDPGLVDEEYEGVGSAKIDVLMEHLQEVTAEGHSVLVFSQFTSYLKRVRARLDDAGIAYAYLDGRTRNRQAAIDQFTSGDRSVFLISLKAGGFGLNLTQADYCYVLDPWWNPASEAQAVDRAHRIGQTRPVMVYRLVSSGTIEEKVMELKARKTVLFDAVMDDGAAALSGALSQDDIRGLLGS